jgi:hypothetical protein
VQPWLVLTLQTPRAHTRRKARRAVQWKPEAMKEAIELASAGPAFVGQLNSPTETMLCGAPCKWKSSAL